VVLGVVLLGEPLGATTLIGSAIVLGGVALVATRTPWAAEAGAGHPVVEPGAPERVRADSGLMRPITLRPDTASVEADA
jgi:hypothetical protein